MDRRRVETDGQAQDSAHRHDGAAHATERMLRAVNAATSGDGANGELDAAARALVTELRRAKEPPEQVLLQIKQILADAGLRPSHGPADPALILERDISVYRDVIESSIRHYFQSDGDEEPARA